MDDNHQPPLKKPKQNHPYVEIRDKKVHGEPHLRHRKNEIVPAKTMGPNCELNCFEVISEEDWQAIFNHFYTSFPTKNDQDAHLAGLISIQPVAYRRPRVICLTVPVLDPANDTLNDDGENQVEEGISPNSTTFYYKIRHKDREIRVCMKALMAIYGVSRGRLRRIQANLVEKGCSPRDKRGQHNNHFKTTPAPIMFFINYHIKSLQRHQSHYRLRDNPKRFYLHEDFKSVADVHRLFLDDYRINVLQRLYRSVFNTYNFGFSMHKSDTCSTCDEFIHNLRSATTNEIKNSLEVARLAHLEMAEKFKELKRSYAEKAKRNKVTVLCFDYMQNLPIPNLNTNDVYYATQLWVYIFGIHNMGTKQATMYVYDEVNEKKGANNVCLLLFQYFKRLPKLPLVLMCDNCLGQNKNKILVRFLYAVVHIFRIVPKVTMIFPVRGHTYLPNDQDFSVLAKKKKFIPAETPDEWIEALRNARKTKPKFEVGPVDYESFFNMTESFAPYFLPTPRPAMKLKSTRMIEISSLRPDVRIRYSYTGKWHHIVVKKSKMPSEVNLPPLYTKCLEVPPRKLQDMKKLFPFTKNTSSREYYSQFLNLENTNPSSTDDLLKNEENDFDCIEIFVEIENDDNSSGEEDA